MEELPILLDGLEVGKVVIQGTAPTGAIMAARDAASHISTTNDTRFCPFSDGSYGNGRGGVSLVYNWRWLPKEVDPDQITAGPSGEFVEQAWPYHTVVGSIAMEGVGLLEGLHAANKTIQRDLHLLKASGCVTKVLATTDCDPILRHIARNHPTKTKAMRTVPGLLIKRIKEEIQMLHGHGIKVAVELHWCPRNKVPQLERADRLAWRAMNTGLGFCNVKDQTWSTAVKSDMTLDIELMMSEPPSPKEAPKISDPPAGLQKQPVQKRQKAKRRERRRKARLAAEAFATSTDNSDTHPQLPLPALPMPSKPGTSAPATNNARSTAPHPTKPTPASPPETKHPKNPAAAEAVKRKVEEEGNSEGGNKKAKLSGTNEDISRSWDTAAPPPPPPTAQTAQRGQEHVSPTMPASWGLDPETKIYVLDVRQGGFEARPVGRCPFIRMVMESTMETGEKNIFVSDGVSPFSMAKPTDR